MTVLTQIKTANPWSELRPGHPPYVHATDLSAIEQHSARVAPEHRIQLDAFPEPYLGHPDAPILLLNLNPGYADWIRAVHAKPAVAQVCMDSLLHRPSHCPFYPLSRAYLDNGGSDWWSKHLRFWIDTYGIDTVARAFFCVEYFPYPSIKYKDLGIILPSQRYSFELVQAKVRAGCTVIVMRARTAWATVLPGVDTSKWHGLNSRQSAYVSPGNMPGAACEAVHAAMRRVEAR